MDSQKTGLQEYPCLIKYAPKGVRAADKRNWASLAGACIVMAIATIALIAFFLFIGGNNVSERSNRIRYRITFVILMLLVLGCYLTFRRGYGTSGLMIATVATFATFALIPYSLPEHKPYEYKPTPDIPSEQEDEPKKKGESEKEKPKKRRTRKGKK